MGEGEAKRASSWLAVFQQPPLRGWFLPMLVMIVVIAVILPYDGTIDKWLSATKLPGDVKRELHAWQQYGQGVCIGVVILLVWLLDPKNRPRVLDYGVALALVGLMTTAGKMLIGRPRPKFDDPQRFLGPFGVYPISKADGTTVLAHAWETSKGISSDLWSMPSSHTAFAAAMSVFLATLYPRIRWVAIALVCVVAMGRMLFDAHYLTDVIAGGVSGWVVARAAIMGGWGAAMGRRIGLVKAHD